MAVLVTKSEAKPDHVLGEPTGRSRVLYKRRWFFWSTPILQIEFQCFAHTGLCSPAKEVEPVWRNATLGDLIATPFMLPPEVMYKRQQEREVKPPPRKL